MRWVEVSEEDVGDRVSGSGGLERPIPNSWKRWSENVNI